MNPIGKKLQNFRQSLYSLFKKRADTLFNLLDALCRDGAYQDDSKQEVSQKTPTQVQRSFANILEYIGTPANPSKPRKKPIGRTSEANNL